MAIESNISDGDESLLLIMLLRKIIEFTLLPSGVRLDKKDCVVVSAPVGYKPGLKPNRVPIPYNSVELNRMYGHFADVGKTNPPVAV